MLTLALLLLFPFQVKTLPAADYTGPPRFMITGSVVVGLDEPVKVILRLNETFTGATYTTESFPNGTFRFAEVLLGTYLISVSDPRFELHTQEVLLHIAEDTSKSISVRLVRKGESAKPAILDASLLTIDANTVGSVSAGALDEYNQGVAALRNPDRKNPADTHFKKAVAAAPKFYEARLQLGLELHRQKKNADAIRQLEQAAALKPAEPRPLSALVELYWESEKFDKVVEASSKLQALGKMTERDHFYLGSAYFRQDNLDKAWDQLVIAINTGNDKDPEPFLQLHNVLVKAKEPVRALAVLEDFLKTFPNHPNHAAMEERAKALRQALKLPPAF
jgi:tetratricopeptide (TPR) repeat protein